MTTRWDRLEPNTTDETLLEGLQARVADPLWMLARQWQNGEFDGEDAATPLRVVAEIESIDLTTVSFANGEIRRLDGNLPLEAVVEAIPPTATSAEDIASLATTALALIDKTVMSTQTALNLLRVAYPFDPASYRPDHPLPGQPARRLRLLSRHAFDPLLLADDGGKKILGKVPRLADWVGEVQALVAACGRSIATKSDAWNGEKLAYEAKVSTMADKEEFHMSLADYGGGRLDWYSFDRAEVGAMQVKLPEVRQRTRRIDTVPLPLTYAGQPVSRYWEYENGEVNFGAIAAGPADIARMIVADFAAIGGDDTFVVPVEAKVGSIVRVKSLLVLDSFGNRATANALTGSTRPLPEHCHRIAPAEAIDRARAPNSTPLFGMFTLGQSPQLSGTQGGWLPILPVTANVMNGKALERVTLRRDEEANLAWAIEEEIEGAFGRALRRRQAWEIEEPVALEEGAAWPYRLQSDVPPWWIPLVPERINSKGQIRLRRARLGAWDTMDPKTTGPKSRLMDNTRAITLDEASLPASGLRMERHWQLARGYDGRLVLWQSWKRTYGASDRASGLVFDAIARRW